MADVDRRLELHELLCGVLGSRNVYFQPPENQKINFPCIIYEHDNYYLTHANDRKYMRKRKYTVTIIDKNPDTAIPEALEELPFTEFSRRFVADNLNNIVYTIYY